MTAGGRVLNVTGLGASREARDRAYAAVERIQFDGKQIDPTSPPARGGRWAR